MILRVDSVQKSFQGRSLLSDIYLSGVKGEVTAVYGRNGSGKSTLFKIIAAVMAAENKYVMLGDQLIKNSRDAVRKINYLPQDPWLPEFLKVKTILKLFDIKDFKMDPLLSGMLDFKIADLSSGQKRIIELYAVLYSNCEFVLLDEPFRGLAPILVEEFKKRLKTQLSNKGIILTDHNYRDVFEISNGHFYLKNGSLKAFNNLEKIGNAIYF